MATIEIKDGTLHVTMNGWDKLLTLRSSLSIPLTHVTGVELRPKFADPANAAKALRLAGGYWPHAFATGYFAVEGEVCFYDVHDAEKTVGVSLEHESVKRLYLEVEGESPEAAADRIRAAIAR
ncbi:MAG: hypothetical protein U0324_42305 [Polyangiales bacterium]